jgi:hypothetical protein
MLFSRLKITNGRVTSKDDTNEITFQGLQIVIENDIGSERKHQNGKVTMYYPYGFLKNTTGIDGEEIDCFIGNEPYAPTVFVIKLAKSDKEEKCMLGFLTLEAARDAFLAHYNDQDFLGEITEIPMQNFKNMIYEE